MKFENKVAIVTGGGSGLGQAICKRLASEGAIVAVADINMEGAEKTVELLKEEGHEGYAVYCNVIDESAVVSMVKEVVERFGRIDLLVNNACIAIESRTSTRICDEDESMWNKGIDLNLKSVFLCSKHVIPEMIKLGKGSICNISSLAAYFPAFSATYGAAKAGVIALTKTIAMQYADDNIRCNCICPGAMQTPSGMNANKIGKTFDYNENAPRVRMVNRIADPMEMANAVCFLLSDEASYITGTQLNVDGGSMAMSVKIPPRNK